MAANQAEVDLVVSAAGALPNLERQLSQIVRTAENQAPEVDLRAGLRVQETIRSLDADLSRVIARAEVDPDNTIDLDAIVDQRRTLRNLNQGLRRAIRAAEAGAPPANVQAEIDVGNSLRRMQGQLFAATRAVQAATPPIEVEVEVDQDTTNEVSRLTRALGVLGRTATTSARGVGVMTGSVAALSLGAGGLANTLAAVAAAVQQIAPAAAVGTSALLTTKLAAGTLKLAMVGVEDAIKGAFDPELTPDEFHESLKNLAPEARLFADALHTMRRELKAVQQGVQNRAFKDFDEIVTNLARRLGPSLTRSLNRAADSLNAMGRNAATAALQLQEQGVFGQALNGANTALERLEKTPARAARSFGFLAAASSPALNRIAIAVDDVSLKIQEKLQRAFESGALERSIDQAVSAIAQLGTVLGNFGAGVSNIFSGLTQNGGGLFDVLEKVSEAFERLTASKEFQTILNELSLTAGVLVDNILPLIQEAFVQLGPVIEELAPVVRDFVAAVGPELIPIIQQLGPILVDIALILKEQLPLAIDLANAAIDALGVALIIVKGGMDLAKEASALFADLLESDFARAMGSASDAAIENSDEIQSAFISWTAGAGRTVRGFQTTLGDFSTNVRKTLVDGFVSAFNDTIGNVREFVGDFIGAIADLPNRAYSIGLDVMNGLAGGLTAGITRVLGIARDIADSVASTIAGALDIRSPSRVTFKLGEFTGEGFALGLASTLGAVAAAAQDAADAVTRNILPTRQVSSLRRAVQADRGTIDPRTGQPFRSDPGALRPSDLPPLARAQSQPINVYVGNEFLARYVDGRIAVTTTNNRRILAQGRRL